MLGFPITYGDEDEGFTSEILINKLTEYWSNEKNQEVFVKGYRMGAVFFGLGFLFLVPKTAFASDLPAKSCPPGPSDPASGSTAPTPAPGSLANVPKGGRGAFGASVLGICGVAMSTGAYWIGFLCAGAVIIGVRMANMPASD